MATAANSLYPEGQKITIENGRLQVPDNPVIPFIEGDGIGPDVWRASRQVLDRRGVQSLQRQARDLLAGGVRRGEGQ